MRFVPVVWQCYRPNTKCGVLFSYGTTAYLGVINCGWLSLFRLFSCSLFLLTTGILTLWEIGNSRWKLMRGRREGSHVQTKFTMLFPLSGMRLKYVYRPESYPKWRGRCSISICTMLKWHDKSSWTSSPNIVDLICYTLQPKQISMPLVPKTSVLTCLHLCSLPTPRILASIDGSLGMLRVSSIVLCDIHRHRGTSSKPQCLVTVGDWPDLGRDEANAERLIKCSCLIEPR
jgi:hypothetical protein